jgi:hypothetical protein
MVTIKLVKSNRTGKKWMVIIDDTKKVHFGATGYSDYTKHKDAERKQRYVQRHGSSNASATTSRKEKWTKDGIDTAGFWSRWLLWNKPTLEESIRDIEKRFSVKITKV